MVQEKKGTEQCEEVTRHWATICCQVLPLHMIWRMFNIINNLCEWATMSYCMQNVQSRWFVTLSNSFSIWMGAVTPQFQE